MSLRVLFVVPGEAAGSSMIFVRRQAESLAAHGVTVETFYLRSRTSPMVLWSEARRLRVRCREFAPQVVHAHFGTMTALFTVLAVPTVPVMITYRGSDLNHVPTAAGPRAWLGRLFSQVAALRADAIVCVSSKLRDQLWWRRGHVTVLASGVDVDRFRPMPRAEARQALGWDKLQPVILFNAGHDARNKRQDLAEAAHRLLQGELSAARLEVLAGDIDPEQMPLYLNAADCLLVTSDAEGSPTIVQEAIATNLPVVSVDVGDVVERLRGIQETHIVLRDPYVIAHALKGILERGRRSNGRLHCLDISAPHIADELTHLYLELAARATHTPWNTTLFLPRSH